MAVSEFEFLLNKAWLHETMETAALATHDVIDAHRSRWNARLTLRVSRCAHGSRLIHSSHEGPLYVQKPFYPEGAECPHIYLLHPPGGVVSGDSLRINVALENGATLLITTPGSNRLYRARTDHPGQAPLKQRIHAKLELQEHSTLEWFPMETIVFNGASIDLQTEVQLEDNALFCGWEIVCLGLPASHEKFSEGHMLQSFSIYKNNRPVLIDRLNIDAGSSLMQDPSGMAALPVSGVFVSGPFTAERAMENGIDALVDALRDQITRGNWEVNVTVTVINACIVIRYLGEFADEARAAFAAAWELLRPAILQRPAVLPRIWAT